MLGDHTAAVLATLGLGAQELADPAAKGAIGTAPR
jgi:hypothetical protein